MVSQLLGWEAGTDLIALSCIHIDMSVALQEAAVPTQSWGGCSMYRASGGVGKHEPHSTLWCAEVSQIFPFLSFLKSYVVFSLFFLVLAHPEAATMLERTVSARGRSP